MPSFDERLRMTRSRRGEPTEAAGSDVRPIIRRESSGTMEAIRESMTAAFQLALLEEAVVQVVLRIDPGTAHPSRVIVGTPYQFGESADGRERVTLRVAEGTDQVLLVERVIRVLPAAVE